MRSIFTCLFVSVALFASAQQHTFKVRAYAGYSINLMRTIQLDDGSFVSVGHISGFENQYNNDAYLLKTDANGQVLASKILYTGSNAFDVDLIKTYDGGFAVSGRLLYMPAMVKFAADLTEQWRNGFSVYNGVANVRQMQQTRDSGYLLAGYVGIAQPDGYRDSPGLLIKLDSRGQVQFVKSYFDSTFLSFTDVAATPDSNYIVAGVAITASGRQTDTLRTVKIRPDGSVIWSRSLYNTGSTLSNIAIAAASDGGVAITGEASVQSNRGTRNFQILAKYDSAGNRLWAKSIATPAYDEVLSGSVTEDRDGGYLFCGELDTYKDLNHTESDTSYGYIVKTDARGVLVAAKTIEPNINRHHLLISNVILTADGGYAACGSGYFFNAAYNRDDDEGFLYKFDSSFRVCDEAPGSFGSLTGFGTGDSGDMQPLMSDIAGKFDSSFFFAPLDQGSTFNICGNGTLPLQLLSFGAALQGKSVSVNWTTANEVNTDYFVVERSADKRSFTALQKIAAKGNSGVMQTYGINDLQPLPGTSYYRLKEVDKDGKVTYSSVVTVTVMNSGTVVISPNPVQNNIRVVVQSAINNNLTLQVVDMKGNVLAVQAKAVVAGRNEINIAAASLARGVYILKVTDAHTTQAIRFVKE